VGDPLAAEPEEAPRLGPLLDLHLDGAVDRGDVELGAEGRLGDADGDVAHDVVPLAAEELVLVDRDRDVEVAGCTGCAGLALAAELEARPRVDARGYLHLDLVLLADAPRAAAGRARVLDHLARAAALAPGL